MGIYLKAAPALLALVIASPLAFGQNAAPGPPPPAPLQSSAGPDGQVMHRPMHPQSMNRQASWNQNRARWGHGDRMGMRERGPGERQFMLARMVRNPAFRERLGITQEQAQKIQTRASDFRIARIRTGADLQVKRLQLKNLLSSENPNRSAIDSKLQEISAARLTQEKAAIDFRLDMRAALTPEQRQKLQQMRGDFFRHGGFDHRGPAGPGGDMGAPDARGY